MSAVIPIEGDIRFLIRLRCRPLEALSDCTRCKQCISDHVMFNLIRAVFMAREDEAVFDGLMDQNDLPVAGDFIHLGDEVYLIGTRVLHMAVGTVNEEDPLNPGAEQMYVHEAMFQVTKTEFGK